MRFNEKAAQQESASELVAQQPSHRVRERCRMSLMFVLNVSVGKQNAIPSFR